MSPEKIATHTRMLIAQRVGEEILRAAELEATNAALHGEIARLHAALEDLQAKTAPTEEPAEA